MKKIVALSLLSTLIASASIFGAMSYSDKKSGRVDRNFVRDDNASVVRDLENHRVYYDAEPSGKMIYSDAIAYCEKMDYLGHKDWKLPTIEELKSLTEFSRRDLNVKHAFKNVQEGIYWSSTKDRHDEAWYVDFDLGRWNTAGYDHTYYALCVRKGD